MTEIFDLLRSEHNAIRKHLHLILNSTPIDYRIAIDFCNNLVEKNHHYKEETIIFRSLVDKPSICAGGPFCVLYYDDHMSYAPFKQVKDLKKQLNVETNDSLSEHLVPLYNKKTPLNIPIEDHQACKQLIEMAENILDSDISRKNHLQLIFETYLRIQDNHFEREEKCFLKMVDSLTTLNEKQSILKQLQNEKNPFIDEDYIQKYLYGKSKIKLL